MKKIYQSPEFDYLTVTKEDILSTSGEPSFIDQQDNYTPDDFLPLS